MTAAKLGFGLIIIAAVCIALFTLSQHSIGAHNNQAWNSQAVLTAITTYGKQPDKSICKDFVVMSCLHAIVRDPSSKYYGRESPQVRMFCQLDERCGLQAVFGVAWGLDRAVYVTGYLIARERFEANAIKDSCIRADMGLFRMIVP